MPVTLELVNADMDCSRPASASLEQEWLAAVRDAEVGQHLLSVDCSQPQAGCESLASDTTSYPSIVLLHPEAPDMRYRGPRRAAA